ncbi:hypothetical protein ASPTUDRAFT_29976 [Aspergillus tubingensis CBS 134.48]|uniref:Uncharacterized protein n=1 Tax=Aspergillus tubingensis (strain CBS 134.48) TaxID=767770 RepID=A0A1L9N3V1_ASPTC|nr:hypothetical protein ASPTUDRAFT_29976 [Aspergillus tubingensis CBS 134.48]
MNVVPFGLQPPFVPFLYQSCYSICNIKEYSAFAMTFTNVLPADLYEGTVDGIAIKWTHNAKARLTTNAIEYRVNATAMKAATENFTHKCSKRLGKTTAIIM